MIRKEQLTGQSAVTDYGTENKKQIARIGGIMAVTGGLGYFLTLLLHGDLPDQTTEIALRHIAGRPEWGMMKLTLMISVLFWIGAFQAFNQFIKAPVSKLLSRLAVISGSMGLAVVIVEYSFIGYALKATADQWVSASGEHAEVHLNIANVILTLSGGLFHSFVTWMIGLPFVFMGTAIITSKEFPSLLGRATVVLGIGALIAGITKFLGIDLIPYPVLYGGFIIPLNFLTVTLGGFMLSRARKLSKLTATPVH